MYESRFGLTRRPFAPADGGAYPATGFEAALAALLEGLADGEPVLTLTGPPGVGKTLLARSLAARLGDAVNVVLVNTAVHDPAGLLRAVLFDLGLPHQGRPASELRLALVEYVLAAFAAGKKTVLLLDEAHSLAAEALEEVRTLGNLEGALQTVLLGQPELNATLDRPELSALAQRVVVRPALEPLGVEEAADYVLHHLRVAGAADGLIDGEALELLARATGGVPRRLNQAAHLALRLAAEAESAGVEVEVMLEALGRLGLSAPEAADVDPCRLFAPAHSA